MARPLLIDLADGACEICQEWNTLNSGTEFFCVKCKAKIPNMTNMDKRGYQSPKPHHFHLKPIGGIQGREAAFLEVCVDCYRELFKEAYPDSPVPV